MAEAPDQRWKVQVGQSISDILYISMGTHNIEIECKGAAGETVASKVVECQVSEVNGFEWTETSQKIGDDITKSWYTEPEWVEVSSVAELKNAISQRKGARLIGNLVTYNDLDISVPGSYKIIIDLNGYILQARSILFETLGSGGTCIISSDGYGILDSQTQSSLYDLISTAGLSPYFGSHVLFQDASFIK